MMEPIAIMRAFYRPGSRLFGMLLSHSRSVADKALRVADRLAGTGLDLDRAFIEEASLLHDIGIFMTQTPNLGCHGQHPYVCHGLLGRVLLEERGLPRHGLVCERHVGVGISAAEIRSLGLPLPERNMLPVTLEEEIICYADKFFSKSGDSTDREKPVEEISANLARYGPDKAERFLAWGRRFEGIEMGRTP
jgi:uncharacterized protein